MLRRCLSFAAVAMMALLVLAACGDDNGEDDVTRIPVEGAPVYPTPGTDAAEATPETPVGSPSPDAATATPDGEETPPPPEGVTVTSVDINFDPKEFSIPADAEVRVSLPNEGVLPHNFSIDALGVDVDIAPGATEETTITAPAGQYEYYCNVTGHKAAGMVGTMTAQ